MLEVKQINNKIDLIIESKKAFFINADETFADKTKFKKFMDFVQYSLKNGYTVMKIETSNDITFVFMPKKKSQDDINYVYALIDNHHNNQKVIDICYLTAEKVTVSKNKIKQKDESEQWFNEM